MPTACDVLASHPDDPNRVAPGRERAEIAKDFPGAIAACRSAVDRDPTNPRLQYQLARVLGYSGQGELAMPHRAKAVEGRYPQALFVVGYLYLTGQNENPKDPCRAGELIRESAIEGRIAGQIGFPRYAMQGLFDGCRRQGGSARKCSDSWTPPRNRWPATTTGRCWSSWCGNR